MLHVVGRQFAEHVISQAIHDTLPRLAATAARVLRLNTDNGRQHLVDHVRLITAPRHSHTHPAVTRCSLFTAADDDLELHDEENSTS